MNDWLDSELDHAELTKAGSALVEVLFFFSLNIIMQSGRKLCPQPHCSEKGHFENQECW